VNTTVAIVFDSGASHLCGGLDILKFDKIPLIYSISYFILGNLELCLGGQACESGEGTCGWSCWYAPGQSL